MWLTSSLFNQIASERIEVLESLKYLLIGGEVLNAKWVNLLNSRATPTIINGYGQLKIQRLRPLMLFHQNCLHVFQLVVRLMERLSMSSKVNDYVV